MMKKANRFFWLFLLLGSNMALFAQDAAWWSQTVGWDGVSHWSRYIRTSAAYMGPNALPVPPISDGRTQNESYLLLGGAVHTAKGDFTQNITNYLNYCPATGKISVDVYYVPVEWFRMSHEVKTERHVFFGDYDAKAAAGDVYVNTRVQVFKEKKARPDLAFRAGIKTASGGTLGAARYTDAPGYYFDASAGKSLLPHDRFRIYGMIGLYVWQTYDPRYLQNDAILYGVGHSLWIKNWTFRQDLSGYWGYLGNGDRPLLYRFRLEHRRGHLLAMLIGQAGLYDFPYKSLELAAGVRL